MYVSFVFQLKHHVNFHTFPLSEMKKYKLDV